MTIIVKPTYNCNFRCRYCYLSGTTKNVGQVMDISLAKEFIGQLNEYVRVRKVKKITLIWHGGEPLLWGSERFNEILAFIHEVLDCGQIINSVQTNLSLIDGEYIKIFKKYNVNVGFSLDGSQNINDTQRVYPNGRGTYVDIMSKVSLCKENGINAGCIVVGSKKHIGKIKELYKFLCEKHLNFKFNPIFVSGEAKLHKDEYGITPSEYADMAIELFDLWYNDAENNLIESNFVEIASNIVSGRTSHCMFGRNCQNHFFALTPNGDIMPCGRFCDEEYKCFSYGNIRNRSLTEILVERKSHAAYLHEKAISESNCKQCEFFSICHGGCLHEGFLAAGDFLHKTFLCSAYKQIFKHIKETIQNEQN